MNKYKSLAASFMLLLLAACGSSGIGDILGGGSGSNTGASEIRGTVDSVDLTGRSIYLTNVSGYSSNLANGGGNAVRVYFDDQTTVEHQGKTYRPEDLERGDEVSVRVDESGNRLIAQNMTVLHDVSGGSSTGGGTYGSTLRGTITYVDPSRRTIEVDRGSGSRTVIEYDSSTEVTYNGRTYRPADLERGDEIDVRLSDSGARSVARSITVVRSISDGTYNNGSSSTATSTLRGTVRYVDTSRRTIELDSTSWVSGFNTAPGAGSSTSTIVQYDPNTSVDVNGRLFPIANLERGDVIDVQVRNAGGSTLVATRVILVRDAKSR